MKNSLGVKEYDYWKLGSSKHREDNHYGSDYKIIAPQGEIITIYDFFRNKPVDRFNSKDNYHRMMIGTWESLKNKEFFRLIGNVAFIAPTFLFGIYYFFVYLISKGNYIWISLTLILLFKNSSINFSTWHLGIFVLGSAVSSVSALVFFITFAFFY